MSYIKTHLESLKEAFSFDRRTARLLLIEFLFVLAMIVAFILIYILLARSIVGIMPILQNSAENPGNVVQLWNAFLVYVILIALLALILFIAITAFFNAKSQSGLSGKDLSWRYFLKFLLVSAILTLAYALIDVVIYVLLVLKDQFQPAAYVFLAVSFIYLYLLFAFYFVIREKDKILTIFKNGFSFAVQLHYALIPFALILIASMVFLLLLYLLLLLLGSYFNIISLLLWLMFYLYFAVWLKKYMFRLYKLLFKAKG